MSAADDPKTLGSGRLGFAEAKDVDVFVEKLEAFERGDLTPDGWRSFRLVNGVYGQRQDDAMMIRVKIPQGILTAVQLEAIGEVGLRWSNGKGHVTTRQNVQFHFVKLADVEAALRHLQDAGLTTKEACGSTVRNVTGCPYAGVSPIEPFDTTPYGEVLTRHLLRGRWSADLPRKFKIAFGGCCGTDCVQAAINDLGFLSRVDAEGRPGFRVTIGGGLATLRRSGFVAHEFLPAEEILEVGEAVVRVFHRIGNRQDKHKARLKWAIDKLGVTGFLAEYHAEREAIRAEGGRPFTLPLQPATPTASDGPAADGGAPPAAFVRDAVRAQKQRGFVSVLVRLPLGDATAAQLKGLAELARRFGEGEVRTTNEQNILLRFVPTARVATLYAALAELDLAREGARTVVDATSCPGSASCKLAVTASRGVADLVSSHLEARPHLVEAARDLVVKASGCPNGCGQHYIAGVSLQGGLRKIDGRAVPQYHLSVGGDVGPDGAVFARLAAKIPARRVGEAVERLIGLYAREKTPGESAQAFFQRVELPPVKALLADLAALDAASATPEDFVDLGEAQAFVVTLSEGECAA